MPLLTGANDFNDVLTVPNLIAYRNTRTCLDSITPTGFGSTGTNSNNDDRHNGVPITNPDFSVTGSNLNATTEAGEQDLVEVGSTVWWLVDADEDGTCTLDTFGSDFDTQLHVYELVASGGFVGLDLVVGNDDTGDLRQSEVTFDTTAGTRYEIRVGGFRGSESIGDGSEGNIVLNGVFAGDALPGDFDFDGDVDDDDVDLYIGNIDQPASGSIEQLDLDGDGNVTIADHDLHVTTLVATSNGITGALLGDVNLDGTVDILLDAFTLIESLGQTSAGRAQGDLNADGVVDILNDAFILIGQLGQSNDPQ